MSNTKQKKLAHNAVMIVILAFLTALFFAGITGTLKVYGEEIAASGTCGECSWYIDNNGTLTISEGVLDEWETDPPWLQYCEQIKAVKINGKVVLKTGKNMFSRCEALENIDLKGLDTSGVSDFSRMFNQCRKLKNIDLSVFDTDNAVTMEAMFSECGACDLNFSSFNTSNVEDMSAMFMNYFGKELDLSGLDFSKAKDLAYFMSGYVYKITAGDLSRCSNRPVFEAPMLDKQTGIEYARGDTMPAVNGHQFVLCKRETGGYTITNISVDKNVVQWGDQLTTTIEYVGAEEVDDIEVSYHHSLFDELYEKVYDRRAASYEITINAKRVLNTMGNAYSESEFDSSTGRGTFRLRVDVRGYKLSGEYVSATVYMRNHKTSGEPFDIKSAEFYDMVPIEVQAPEGDIVFDKDYEEDLTSALRELKDGDTAIARPQIIEPEDLPADLSDIPEEYLNQHIIIKKEYYEAIQGKDVTILIPMGSNYAKINGRDISGDVKDVYLPAGAYLASCFTIEGDPKDEDIMHMKDYALKLDFPNNGKLPSKMTLCLLRRYTEDDLRYEMEDALKSGGTSLYTEDQIDDIINSLKLYYMSNGELVQDGAIDFTDKRINITIDHNSSFVLTGCDIKDMTSFTADLSKSRLTYNGKKQKPKVLYSSKTGWGSSRDYSITYSNPNSKAIGTYKVTVKAGKIGFGSETLEYEIVPKGTTLKKPAGGKRSISVKWKQQSAKMGNKRITGYQIQYSTSKKFTQNVKTLSVSGYKRTSKTIKKLKSRKTYYVRVRTYMKVNGKKYYSSWSSAKSVKTK